MTHPFRKLVAIAALVGASPAAASPVTAPKGDAAAAASDAACRKTVNAIGASMSREAAKDADGRPASHFVVRANGIDYDVVCDPASGVVKDVARRMTAGAGSE
ncbi:MAG TPA: hypothetical protein VJ045_03690 [Hyphomicrobiaceae bacterium]|nr:hypothetical protein [Hyphomicrobiaceae bacterium]